MTISSTQAVGSALQGSYAPAPQPEPVQANPEVVSNAAEVSKVSTAAKQDTNSETKDKEANQEAIRKAVSDINKHANGTEAVFGIHEKTNRITIKIVDKKSKEVIKEVPAEKTLDLIAKAWELAGLMVDEKR